MAKIDRDRVESWQDTLTKLRQDVAMTMTEETPVNWLSFENEAISILIQLVRTSDICEKMLKEMGHE